MPDRESDSKKIKRALKRLPREIKSKVSKSANIACYPTFNLPDLALSKKRKVLYNYLEALKDSGKVDQELFNDWENTPTSILDKKLIAYPLMYSLVCSGVVITAAIFIPAVVLGGIAGLTIGSVEAIKDAQKLVYILPKPSTYQSFKRFSDLLPVYPPKKNLLLGEEESAEIIYTQELIQYELVTAIKKNLKKANLLTGDSLYPYYHHDIGKGKNFSHSPKKIWTNIIGYLNSLETNKIEVRFREDNRHKIPYFIIMQTINIYYHRHCLKPALEELRTQKTKRFQSKLFKLVNDIKHNTHNLAIYKC